MATTAYHTPSSTRPQLRAVPARATPETVAAFYAAGHTTAEAVAYFGVSNSYLRRMKRQAVEREQISANSHASQIVANLPPSQHTESAILRARHARVYDAPRLVYHAAVARGHELWWCPRCSEYMHPLPGDTGKAWNERGCYLHAAEPEPVPEPAPAIVAVVPEPEPAPSVAQRQPSAEPVPPGRAVSPEPERATYHNLPPLAEAPPDSAPEQAPQPRDQPIPEGYHSRSFRDAPTLAQPIVRVRVVRVPDRARNGGLLGWLAEHEAARKQLLGLVVLLVLIGLSWLG
jgi:hypothetical protein